MQYYFMCLNNSHILRFNNGIVVMQKNVLVIQYILYLDMKCYKICKLLLNGSGKYVLKTSKCDMSTTGYFR